MAGPYTLVVRSGPYKQDPAGADVYGPGDTPMLEIDCFGPDGITPVTPTGGTATLYNRQTRATGANVATITPAPGKLLVELAAIAAVGSYRVAVEVQLDAVPTLKTATYDFVVERPV